MCRDEWEDTMTERRITYALEAGGKVIVVEDAPAGVRVEAREHSSSPETVEHL